MKGFRAGRGIVRAKFPLKNTMTASLSSRPISRIVIHDNFVVHPRWSSTTSFFEPIVCCALRLTIGCSLPHTAPGAHGRGFHGAHSPEVGWSWDVLDISGGRCGCRVHERVLTGEPGAPAQVLWPGTLPWTLHPASGRHPRTTPGVQRPRKFRYSGCRRSTPGMELCALCCAFDCVLELGGGSCWAALSPVPFQEWFLVHRNLVPVSVSTEGQGARPWVDTTALPPKVSWIQNVYLQKFIVRVEVSCGEIIDSVSGFYLCTHIEPKTWIW